MQPPDECCSPQYDEAVVLHKQHRYEQAAELYRVHLRSHPDDARALAALAAALMCAHGPKKCDEAIQLARRAVQLRPSCARTRHTLGRLYEKAQPPRWADAADAYERACEKDASNVQMLLDLARALKEMERPARAADAYMRALSLAPGHPKAHFKLAMVLRQLGRGPQAVEHFRRHLEIEPGHVASRFWLAALSGDAADAAACPPEMVAGLFDQYAEKFDEHLVGVLQYKTPELLRDLLLETASRLAAPAGPGSSGTGGSRWRSCADLGCGTGLMGPLLRPSCDWMAGIDLSAGMCDKACERGCYDLVEVAELVEWLQRQQAARQARERMGQRRDGGAPFDLLVAADVLVYIGDLRPLLQAAAAAAEPGALFALSTELLPDRQAAGDEGSAAACSSGTASTSGASCSSGAARGRSRGYTLQPTGRYAHSPSYIEAAAAETGWQVAALRGSVIRINAGKPIHGNLAVLERLGAASG